MVDLVNNSPMYRQVYESLKERIVSGKAERASCLPSESNLCSEFDVSSITIRKALTMLREEGYIFRKQGKGTFVADRGNEKNIALLYANNEAVLFGDAFYGKLLEAIRKEVENLRFAFTVVTFDGRGKSLPQNLDGMIRRREIEGVLIVSDLEREIMEELSGKDVDIVSVDFHFEDLELDSVVFDNEGAGRMAAEYLLDLGHGKFGYIDEITRYGERLPVARERLAGFKERLKEAGMTLEEKWYAGAQASREGGAICMGMIMKEEEKPTAVFCFDDDQALGAIEVVERLELRVPEDVSVMGFGGKHPRLAGRDFGITSLESDVEEMGRMGVRKLWKRINGDASPKSKEVLPVRLGERGSTGRRH